MVETGPAPTASTTPAPAAPPHSPAQRNAGIIVIATGIAATLGAVGFQVGAVIKKGQADQPDQCVNGFCTPQGFESAEQARRFADIGQWLGVGGLATLAIGATIFATAPDAPKQDDSAWLQLTPWATVGGGGAHLRGVW
jgi:hypothetical protein